MTETNQTPEMSLDKVNQLLREAKYIVTSIQKNEQLDNVQGVHLREIIDLIEKAKAEASYTRKYWNWNGKIEPEIFEDGINPDPDDWKNQSKTEGL